jgi:hypothetical protein
MANIPLAVSDIRQAVKYLDDAAQLYDQQQAQRYVSRAYFIRRLARKLNKKLLTE